MTPDGWSPKDAMFHVGAWCAEAALDSWSGCGSARTSTRGSTSEAQNRAWFEISRELDVPTVKAELHAARTKMRQEWCELGERGDADP